MLLIIIVAGLLTFYYLLGRPLNYWKNRGVKQGKPWILFGDSLGIILRKMSIAEAVTSVYDLIPPNTRYYGIYQFMKPKLVVRDPDLIRRITVKDFDHFVDHVAMADPKADPLFAKNLLGLKGEEWRKMRSTLTGSFTSSKMKIMFNLVTEAAEDFVNYFEKQQKNNKILDIEMKDAFTRFTIDVIASTSFGVKVDSLNEPDNEFFKMGKEISQLSFKTVLKMLLFQASPKIYRFFNLSTFRKEVYEFFGNLINETITTREAKGIHRPDMLQILMEAKKGIDKEEPNTNMNTDIGFTATTEYIPKAEALKITNEDIIAQAVIFFFAGFDSVSSLMTFTAYELAVNQQVQDKLRQEILATNQVTFEVIANMPYMDMVISEALRKWPPFVVVGRECTKTYIIKPKLVSEAELIVPKGMAIQIPTYAIHHDPKYYPEPEQFIPERFSAENRNKLTPYTFLGFGQGPRSCIGSRFALLELKIVFFCLLKRLRLVVNEKTQVPVKLKRGMGINIRPEDGLWLGLEKLN
ncbi:unnamed protein product [Ceutorhynchus assimilis]|uniref:Cytochrome P450 n=1 Tax=Ceutorhynchus assimilis TaxID=467358 RepID=A0A9N9N0S2_9CUCU|nr:unnamed protein product [Ceutorhynchus assimilis]